MRRMEARGRIELPHKGFADLSLTTWVPRLERREIERLLNKTLERETGFEPATSTLARSHSTTELFPLSRLPSASYVRIIGTVFRRCQARHDDCRGTTTSAGVSPCRAGGKPAVQASCFVYSLPIPQQNPHTAC